MRQVNTIFTTTAFDTEAEAFQAACLSDAQKANVQNCIAGYAKERANLTIDYTLPDAMTAYMLGQQKLLGAIEALQYLVAQSEDAFENLTALTRNNRI